MKSKKKAKSHKKGSPWPPKGGGTLVGMQKTRVRPVRPGDFPEESSKFTPQETAGPDTDQIPDIDNPQGVQSGRGPTNQEGEGELQNDQLAALEQIEPDIDL